MVEHVRGEGGGGVGYPGVSGVAVGEGEESPDPSGDGVFGHGGSIIRPSASRDTWLWVTRKAAAAVKFLGTWSPRMSRARCTRAAAAAAAWVARVWLASSKLDGRSVGVCSGR